MTYTIGVILTIKQNTIVLYMRFVNTRCKSLSVFTNTFILATKSSFYEYYLEFVCKFKFISNQGIQTI